MKTIHDTEPDDKLLMELMLKMPVEKAPESFTSGVMQQVYSGFGLDMNCLRQSLSPVN